MTSKSDTQIKHCIGQIATGALKKEDFLLEAQCFISTLFSVSEVSVCDCPITHGLAGFHALSCVIEACGS